MSIVVLIRGKSWALSSDSIASFPKLFSLSPVLCSSWPPGISPSYQSFLSRLNDLNDPLSAHEELFHFIRSAFGVVRRSTPRHCRCSVESK